MTVDRDRAVASVKELLVALGEDPFRPGLIHTPGKVADRFIDLFAGVCADPAVALGEPVAADASDVTDIVGLRQIRFRSLCEHHLLPFDGTIDVWYAPSGQLAGLSRVISLIRVLSNRPTLQERLTRQIADTIGTVLGPIGVTIRIQARHGCVAHSDLAATDTEVVTVVTCGTMPDVFALNLAPATDCASDDDG